MHDPRAAQPILVVAFNGIVYGLEPTTGREVWRKDLGFGVPAVAFVGERVYAAGGGNLVCLDYRTGSEIWSVKTAFGSSKAALVAQGGLLFLAWTGEVECYSEAGERLWQNPFKGAGYSETALGFPGNYVHAFLDAR